MNESDYIALLAAYAKDLGWSVDLTCFDLHRGGRCHYPDDPRGPLIEINEPEARPALMILAHEVGHALGYTHVTLYLEFSVEVREWIAWSRGWGALQEIGADTIVSHKEWREFMAYG